MTPTIMTTYQQKITFGEMRESGVRDVLIYCRDHRCSHHVETNAAGPALRHRTELHHCSKKGAEVRPKFSHARMGTG
jgi:hypothetical protein